MVGGFSNTKVSSSNLYQTSGFIMRFFVTHIKKRKNSGIYLCLGKIRTTIAKLYSSYCLSAISLFALQRHRNISKNLLPKLGHVLKRALGTGNIPDPSTLNLLVLLLCHHTDSKPHNVNTADRERKKWNYPV